MKKSMKPGGGGRFQKLSNQIQRDGKSKEQANAIAAAVGRAKYGASKMASMAANGRKRSIKSK